MVYLCCAPLPDDFSLKNSALSLKARLGEENNEYIDKVANRIPSAAAEGLYALSLLLKMLDRYFPLESKSIKLLRNENGKPYFENSAIQFNISHSRGVVACAITDSGEIGIDIEASDLPPERANGIMSRFFSQAEREMMAGDITAFKRAWTRKEAAAKMQGVALADYLKKSKIGEPCDDSVTHFFEISAYGYPVTVCINSTQNEIIPVDAKALS